MERPRMIWYSRSVSVIAGATKLMQDVLGKRPEDVTVLIDEIDPDATNAESRFADAVQRLVLYAQADGCRFPGCDEPAVRCQVHHLKPWNDGGRTTLENLLLVCRAHHNKINGSPDGWSVRPDPHDLEKFVWTPNTPPRDSAEPA